MQTVYIVVKNCDHQPIVFTSFLAIRTWCERKKYTININKNTINDKENKSIYSIIRTIAYTNKDVKDGLAG